MRLLYNSGFSKLLLLGIITLCISCDQGDVFNDVVLIKGAEVNNIIPFVVDGVSSSIALTASSTAIATEDIDVEFKIDSSLVQRYNEDNKTLFYLLPTGSYSLSQKTTTIKTGSNVSEAVKLTVTSLDKFVEGRIYIVPVSINVIKGNLKVLKSSATAFLKIVQVITTSAADFKDGPYFDNKFTDTLTLNAFTLECRLKANAFGVTFHINSLFAFDGTEKTSNASAFNLLRFGELSDEINQLQWINSVGKVSSKTLFATNTWYHIAAVFDGQNCSLYVNGKLDGSFPAVGKSFFLNRFQISAASQPFVGYLSEVRLWSRALSVGELQNSFCAVDPANPDLVCYWKMNESTGAVFTDYSGHGHRLTAPSNYSWIEGVKCPE